MNRGNGMPAEVNETVVWPDFVDLKDLLPNGGKGGMGLIGRGAFGG